MLYISSSCWLLGVESHDFSHAKEERTACKADQIHTMKTIFTQNGPRLSLIVLSENSCHFVNLPSFARVVLSFSA